MEHLLKVIPFIVAFQDDVLINGVNDADHFANLDETLTRHSKSQKIQIQIDAT